jgi:oligoendopeptidase F
MSANLERVVNEAKSLTADELRKLRDSVDEMLNSRPKMSEDEFEQYLLAKGVITSIPTRDIDAEEYRKRKLIQVEGKPVSETLIEERR